MQTVSLASDLSFSRIIHGLWRLQEWKMTKKVLLDFIRQAMDMGVTTFDHADIYGDFSCEKLFGDALALEKGLRQKIQIVTKCGIKPVTKKYPGRKIKVYDYSREYIIRSVEKSLANFRTDHIDVLLVHRPSPMLNPEEVAAAFAQLKQSGKVLHFGVSNFTPGQYDMLNAWLDDKPVTNQVEISPLCLEHFENGNMDFFLKERIRPMAWSPLAGGRIFNPKTERGHRVSGVLTEIAEELNTASVDQVAYAWLLKHPAGIMPVAGTGNIRRLKLAVEALDLEMSLEQWFRIYVASTGEELP
ncbi:MAG: oxidoreductase [Chlorobi bacterium]|nr:oxidoreductase [Chlorobiota bacterium]